ncbi:MAG: McrC family protein [Myxacorys californica WJT36-NPBG1]|jgi:5-methylcytosine-specific restriction enzyme subunit McrC|nr:McrC family protein [Myxacorys californica WJT36-NPBG1]
MLWQGTPQTELVTLFEHESTEISDGYELKCLEQLSRVTGIEILKPVVRKGQLQFQARQYVGVVRLGRRTIQILPKVYRSQNREQSQQEAARNLLLMLDYARYLGIREANLAALQRSQNWFEVLIYLFASHLKHEWQKATHRSYQPIDAVLPVLKGKWQIATQLRRPEQKHLFTVTYDEFTIDNPLNRIFRYVVERLWQLTRDSSNRQNLTELRYWMDEVTLLPVVTADMAKQVQLSRLNKQYEPLLNLAQLFLERLGLQLSASDITTFSFVFDMNQLFERFIVSFIQRHRHEVLPPLLNHCELLPQGQRAVQYLANREGQRVFRLKPDLVFQVNDQFPIVMDIKYKHLNEGDRKLGVAESDFYQMYAYAHQYTCPRVILLYPQTMELSAPQRAHFKLEGSNQEIWAVTVNLLQDLSKSETRGALQAELREILEGAYE